MWKYSEFRTNPTAVHNPIGADALIRPSNLANLRKPDVNAPNVWANCVRPKSDSREGCGSPVETSAYGSMQKHRPSRQVRPSTPARARLDFAQTQRRNTTRRGRCPHHPQKIRKSRREQPLCCSLRVLNPIDFVQGLFKPLLIALHIKQIQGAVLF